MKKPSQRFQPSAWMKWLVPFLLVLILLGLAASLVIVLLSVTGITPG
jgi:hypothetical protein